MIELLTDPSAWAALAALIVMELVLGIDNLVFIAIATEKLPSEQRHRARQIGIGLALVTRLALLATLSWIIGLTATVFDLGISGAIGHDGLPTFETAFSWRDIILLVGGAFLVWKATSEIHERTNPDAGEGSRTLGRSSGSFALVICQIVALDLVFSVDSILTAVGMTNELPIMMAAVIVAVGAMFLAADPLSRFLSNHPSVVMLALAFLLSIGMILVAEGFGHEVPKGYIYIAIGFASFVELLNTLSKTAKQSKSPKVR